MYGSEIFYSKGLRDLFDNMNKASIDVWELALNVVLEYKANKNRFKECYGFDTPEEVLSNSYEDAYKRREAYIKKLNDNTKLKKRISNLLDEYSREEVLKVLREVSEG
jgi:hypothetical protein